jgi:hypothetical protein
MDANGRGNGPNLSNQYARPTQPIAVLRDFLKQDWGLASGPDADLRLAGGSITDAVVEYLDIHIGPRKKLWDEKRGLYMLGSNSRPPQLGSLTAGMIIQNFTTLAAINTPDLEDFQSGLFRSLPENVLCRLFEDPRMPYMILRRTLKAYELAVERKMGLVDIDEMVLKHERHLRSMFPNALDPGMLVTLQDLALFSDASPSAAGLNDGYMSFSRQDPPKGGLELFDDRRHQCLKIQPNDKKFAAAFDRVTSGVFQGMDWANVIVAGDLVLHTLLIDIMNRNAREYEATDILLHIWGLNPSDTLKKIESIYDAWRNNVQQDFNVLCIKTSNYIILKSHSPDLLVKIRLKLFSNPLHVLLHYHPHICGIGFDGLQVRMLPSCARALETGYDTFTSAYLYDDPFYGSTPESQVDIHRIIQLAEMGFGIRILPSYARSLRDEIDVARLNDGNDLRGLACNTSFWRDSKKRECGLKILKRLAFLGQNWVRNVLGLDTTALRSHCEYMRDVHHMEWAFRYHRVAAGGSGTKAFVGQTGVLRDTIKFPDTTSASNDGEIDDDDDGSDYIPGLANDYPALRAQHGEIGPDDCATEFMLPFHNVSARLGCFETFVRQCELWHQHTGILIDEFWKPPRQDYSTIFLTNDRIFQTLKRFICARVDVDYRDDGCECIFETLDTI